MAESANVVQATETLDDGLMVQLVGEIDLTSSPRLRTELMTLLESNPERLVVDLQSVPLMDSSGVATLIEVLQVQRNAGRKLVLCGLQEKVQSVFEITRLSEVFLIVGDLQSAKQA